jgi:hypothetical protein
LAGTLEQHRQDLDRLLLKPNAQAALAQFTRDEVQLEDPEGEPSPGLIVRAHDEVNLRRSVPHVSPVVGQGTRSIKPRVE